MVFVYALIRLRITKDGGFRFRLMIKKAQCLDDFLVKRNPMKERRPFSPLARCTAQAPSKGP